MPRRRYNRSFQGGAPRRQTEWLASADATVYSSVGPGITLLSQSLSTVEKAKLPFTVTRTIGQIAVMSDQTAAQEEAFGALGFQVANENAVTVGVTALLSPILNEDADQWFVYQPAACGTGNPTGVAGVFELGWQVYSFDSRAQRKVEEGQDIAIVFENAAGAFGMKVLIKFRMLIKLH